CQSLLNFESDLVIAGGVSITFPLKAGYLFEAGMIFSSDGICRAFDTNANGTVAGNGAGIVILKRAKEAFKDKDNIYSIIKGFAINNDGRRKAGFSAPSVASQTEVINMALNMANIVPNQITYIETHGTGTSLGDMIEITALNEVYQSALTYKQQKIALSSVKPNIGHLDVASGIAGLIKAVFALKTRTLPPTINFKIPNPYLNIEDTPFYVNTDVLPWLSYQSPLYAGVSSFGLGGTNVHLILQEAINFLNEKPQLPTFELLILSARNESALKKYRKTLANYLTTNSNLNLADVAFTLQVGRKDCEYRYACICTSLEEAIISLNDDNFSSIELDISKVDFDKKIYYQLSSLAENWLNGHDIDWQKELYSFQRSPLARIPLPTYPFSRREFFFTKLDDTVLKKQHDYTNLHENIDEIINAIFCKFLGITQVGRNDNFFEIGGDSLVALQTISAINQYFNITLPVDILVQYPSLTMLINFIKEKTKK
ncbi:MAG: ketoacyl-synthetase C-terminal extension domain-containing protein, partial [Gammaproteobacteria bacterium]